MADSIDRLLDQLPESGLTVRALQMLDFVAPGQWQNLTGFENTIRAVTGESDPDLIARVGARAVELSQDASQGYQRALSIYRFVDAADSKLGLAAAAHKLGESFRMLSFLDRLTPKPEKTQAIDLAMKLVAETAAFCYANGFPGDGIGDFMAAVGAYEKENLIRMAGIVTFDGLIPLGPDFGGKLLDQVGRLSESDLAGNAVFQRVQHLLPGGGLSLITGHVGALGEYVSSFAAGHGITLEGVLDRLRGVIDFSEDKLEYLGAALDMTLNYMEHSGTQSVARSLIERAIGEV
jgi:hypothetical protein